MTQILQEELDTRGEEEEARKQPLRKEDIRLMKGAGHFVDDLAGENYAYMALVHSPFAHAKIRGIDLSKARASEGFIASLTGEDLVKEGVTPVTQNQWPAQRAAKRYHLALGEVRFVGEPVVAILAKDRVTAEDLVDMVDVDYEILPSVNTIEESKENNTRVYDDWEDNVSQRAEQKKGGSDADKTIAGAKYVVRAVEGIRRQAASPIEPHSVIVGYDGERGMYDVYATVQTVHGLQRTLSSELKLPSSKFRVRVMDMGGGFGTKGGTSYPWPVLACLFAKKTGRAVKWTSSRTEEFLESSAGRDEYCDATLACDKDGKIVALKARIECDIGVSGTQVHMPSMTMWTMSGPYAIPISDLAVTSYVTNKMPIGPVRGAGAPEGCYFMERVMEIMAKKIGLDPIEFRRRNVGSAGNRPESSEEYQSLLDTLIKSSRYDELLRWREEPAGGNLVRGIGISLRGEAEVGGHGDGNSEQGDGESWEHDGNESASEEEEDDEDEELSFATETARVSLNGNGDVTVYTGASPHGQGHETSFAQLASEELGVSFDRIRLVWGDTAVIPRGVGTFGSRSMTVGGSAVVEASRKLKSDILERSSKLLGVDRASLDIRDGSIVRKGEPATVLKKVEELPGALGVLEISASSKFTLDGMASSSAAHVCALTLDTDTGEVRIGKYVVAEDCGRMINRAIVEGQIHGGVVNGVGGALSEQLVYDRDGNLLTTSFLDYSIPSAMDSPQIEVYHRVTPSAVSLNQARGVGESGTIAAYAAVMNALNDALSRARGKKKEAEVNVAPALPQTVYYSLGVE